MKEGEKEGSKEKRKGEGGTEKESVTRVVAVQLRKHPGTRTPCCLHTEIANWHHGQTDLQTTNKERGEQAKAWRACDGVQASRRPKAAIGPSF